MKDSVQLNSPFETLLCSLSFSTHQRVIFVSVPGDEAAQVGAADRKLPPVSGALQCPHHTGGAELEGERPRPFPPDRPKCSWKVIDGYTHTHLGDTEGHSSGVVSRSLRCLLSAGCFIRRVRPIPPSPYVAYVVVLFLPVCGANTSPSVSKTNITKRLFSLARTLLISSSCPGSLLMDWYAYAAL